MAEISWTTSTGYYHARLLPVGELFDLYDNLGDIAKELEEKRSK